ncbi:uncharacterized protein LOC127560432 [Antechinus flavipes]|uniref:uncharacterized protein LOC127560432 n=1 Tax=Antechinus flavipes TaxID=38775 RepID=UPI002235BA62|nr:uncharacterized protein LOC127560432 [Antechinus flavipes]
MEAEKEGSAEPLASAAPWEGVGATTAHTPFRARSCRARMFSGSSRGDRTRGEEILRSQVRGIPPVMGRPGLLLSQLLWISRKVSAFPARGRGEKVPGTVSFFSHAKIPEPRRTLRSQQDPGRGIPTPATQPAASHLSWLGKGLENELDFRLSSPDPGPPEFGGGGWANRWFRVLARGVKQTRLFNPLLSPPAHHPVSSSSSNSAERETNEVGVPVPPEAGERRIREGGKVGPL